MCCVVRCTDGCTMEGGLMVVQRKLWMLYFPCYFSNPLFTIFSFFGSLHSTFTPICLNEIPHGYNFLYIVCSFILPIMCTQHHMMINFIIGLIDLCLIPYMYYVIFLRPLYVFYCFLSVCDIQRFRIMEPEFNSHFRNNQVPQWKEHESRFGKKSKVLCIGMWIN